VKERDLKSPNPMRRPGDRTKGSAALVCLTALLPLVVAGGTMLAVVVRGRTALETELAKKSAADAASSGAQDALAKLQGDPDFTGSYDVDVGGTSTRVTVTSWIDDKIDNDELNGVDDPGEAGFVEVDTVAWVNVVTDGNGNRIDVPSRRFRGSADVLLKRLDANVAIAQSAYVDDENSDVDFQDAPFTISGVDTNLDGTAGPLPDIPGIGVPGDVTAITHQIEHAAAATVLGSGGTPSVVTVAATDVLTLMNHYIKAATIHFNGTDDDASGTLGDLSTMTPAIAHAHGNLKLHGGVSGCGMLLVDGDLEISDKFDYAGLIFARGSITFTGDGEKNLHGALLTTGSILGKDLKDGANVALDYSSSVLTSVSNKLANSYVLVSWTQR
jgi:hypothetical protein